VYVAFSLLVYEKMNLANQNIIGIIRATGMLILSPLLLLLVGSLKLPGLMMA
jgi:hypothetical protein